MDNFNKQIETAAALIQSAQHAIALTGAGISTPSGIPDFRSPGSGLWNHVNPMDVASIIAFRQRPEDFYNWVRPLSKQILNAKPNAAHLALAELEAAGRIKTIITQNIDGLHQAAHSEHVLEVHGHIRSATCVRCYKQHNAAAIMTALMNDDAIPTCDACGGPLKPDVILFGEQLPVQPLFEARNAAAQADVILVAGSSLEVAPIAELPHDALRHGAKIIIINYQETYLDSQATVVIHHDVTDILPELAAKVLG